MRQYFPKPKVNRISTTDTSNLVKKTDYNTKVSEIENKINDHDHVKCITTQEFIELTSEHFAARLAQANLKSNNDIANLDDKLIRFKKRINSNKSKHVLVGNELNELPQKLKQYQQNH